MSETVKYVANGGQTYLPCQDNVNVPFVAYEKPEKPNPLLPELELNQDAIDKGYVLPSQKQHFLPGITSEMMDWFWANMEKGLLSVGSGFSQEIYMGKNSGRVWYGSFCPYDL